VLVFATSDKGGTGRSVTSSNVLYRMALEGRDVCYLDFDFGSPTSGAIFNLSKAERGVPGGGGLHSYLHGRADKPTEFDVWVESDRATVRAVPHGSGRLTFFAGDESGGEFPTDNEKVARCADLFLRLDHEYDVILVDLSAGRSHATDMVLAATAELSEMPARWLVFHRWTRQHVLAAAGLVFGDRGIMQTGVAECGHDEETLRGSLRFVRTAVVNLDSPERNGLRGSQVAWLIDRDRELRDLAGRYGLGLDVRLGSVPLDPVLQLREQLISDEDVEGSKIANSETVAAFADLGRAILDNDVWSDS
jgi:hypothetical protein